MPDIFTTLLDPELGFLRFGVRRLVMKFRSFLYPDGSGYPRCILRKAGNRPLPRPPMPGLMYEEEGALFRRRADRTISLRVQDTLVHENRRYEKKTRRAGEKPVRRLRFWEKWRIIWKKPEP